jgi:hypothetical protein
VCAAALSLVVATPRRYQTPLFSSDRIAAPSIRLRKIRRRSRIVADARGAGHGCLCCGPGVVRSRAARCVGTAALEVAWKAMSDQICVVRLDSLAADGEGFAVRYRSEPCAPQFDVSVSRDGTVTAIKSAALGVVQSTATRCSAPPAMVGAPGRAGQRDRRQTPSAICAVK